MLGKKEKRMGTRRPIGISFVFFLCVALAGDNPPPLSGQIIVPFEPANRVDVSVKANVIFDSSSSLYTYSYELTSALASEQEVSFFALQFSGAVMPTILNPTAPQGWSFGEHDDLPMFSWGATEVGPLPPDFVDDGNVVPSPFQIKPGRTLGGFSFQSPEPPDDAQFFVQGFTKLPHAVDAEEIEVQLNALGVLDFRDDSFRGTTVGPRTLSGDDAAFLGGRRPAVDGFLVFLNIADGDTRNAPVGIVIKFSLSGEVVDRSTFRAELNGEDVTASFQPSNPPGDLTAVFALGSSPLKQGRNVLVTSVEGIVPGTNRTATDTDRLTFSVP